MQTCPASAGAVRNRTIVTVMVSLSRMVGRQLEVNWLALQSGPIRQLRNQYSFTLRSFQCNPLDYPILSTCRRSAAED